MLTVIILQSVVLVSIGCVFTYVRCLKKLAETKRELLVDLAEINRELKQANEQNKEWETFTNILSTRYSKAYPNSEEVRLYNQRNKDFGEASSLNGYVARHLYEQRKSASRNLFVCAVKKYLGNFE